jgi:hypothetical protein
LWQWLVKAGGHNKLPKMCMWEGQHMVNKARLRLTIFKDRSPLIVLQENQRQILSCRIDRCGGVH